MSSVLLLEGIVKTGKLLTKNIYQIVLDFDIGSQCISRVSTNVDKQTSITPEEGQIDI